MIIKLRLPAGFLPNNAVIIIILMLFDSTLIASPAPPRGVSTILAAGIDEAQETRIEKQDVDNAVRRGLEYLLRKQWIDGSWSREGRSYIPGYTALCTLALVKSGIPQDHPSIQKAMNFLSHYHAQRTYDVAVLLVLLEYMDSTTYKPWIQRLAQQLIDTQITGIWAYPTVPNATTDLSNSQYAAMGLRAAAAAGVPVHRKVWEDLIHRVVVWQKSDGGWGYRLESHPTGSMTCAGLTCLLICREQLRSMGRGISAQNESQRALDLGLNWLDRHFQPNINPRPEEKPAHYRWTYYYLYGLERVAAFARRPTFGGRDWYHEGASWLLKAQGSKGQWSSAYNESEINTPFAVLFLTRATLSTYTSHNQENRILSEKGKTKHDIVIGCDRKNPGHVWIESWSQKVADKFGIEGGNRAIRVDKVVYLIEDEVLGEVTNDPTGGRVTRYPFAYRFTENGDKKISAKVTCVSRHGTIREAFDSGAVSLFVHNNLTDQDRSSMEDVRTNIISTFKPQVEVSSAMNGSWGGGRSVDGLQGTSWLSADPKDDQAPWIQLVFAKPVRADCIKLSHALNDPMESGRYGRASKVLVQINRKSQKLVIDLNTEAGVKNTIDFKKTAVRVLRIEMLDRVKGSKGAAAGFAEIELFLKPKKK